MKHNLNDSSLILSNACAEYLKSQPGSKRLLHGIRERYITLGRLGGSVTLTNLSMEERNFFRSLLKKDFQNEKALISVSSVIKGFNGTRFEGVQLLDVLELYFKDCLVPRAVVLNETNEMQRAFYDDISLLLRSTWFKEWVLTTAHVSGSSGYRILYGQYRINSQILKNAVIAVDIAITVIEELKTHVSLPVLSAKVTQDPHAFDQGTLHYKILVQAFASHYDVSVPENAEEMGLFLYQIGILQDTGHRTVLTYGLDAIDISGNSKGWDGFSQRFEALTIGLQNLEGIQRIELVNASQKSVYCFENPAVFQYVIASNSRIAAVCTNGQLNQAVVMLLDLIIRSHLNLAYSGDFDPEGLVIAQKLKSRFGDFVSWICYNPEYYEMSLSKNTLNSKRLSQLNLITDSELVKVAERMKELGRAGYQEVLLDEIVSQCE